MLDVKVASTRLRKGKDDDLIDLLENLPKEIDRSDFIRDALRSYGKTWQVIYRIRTTGKIKE